MPVDAEPSNYEQEGFTESILVNRRPDLRMSSLCHPTQNAMNQDVRTRIGERRINQLSLFGTRWDGVQRFRLPLVRIAFSKDRLRPVHDWRSQIESLRIWRQSTIALHEFEPFRPFQIG